MSRTAIYGSEVAQHRLEELLDEVERLRALYRRLEEVQEGEEREKLEAELYASVLTLELRSAKVVACIDELVNGLPIEEPQLA